MVVAAWLTSFPCTGYELGKQLSRFFTTQGEIDAMKIDPLTAIS